MNYVFITISLLYVTAFNTFGAMPTFYWDFETEVPNICSGGACEPHYSAGAQRSTESARDGSWALKNAGEWSQGGVHNYSNDHVWASMTEATVEFDWQYVAPYSNRMLFQFSGDWTNSEYDHDDGFKLTTRSDGEFQLWFGYSAAAGGYPTVWFRPDIGSFEDGKWYHIVAKFKQGVGMALIVDGREFTKTAALDGIQTVDRAWHNVTFGNDLASDMTQYLDNFMIYDHWTDSSTASGIIPQPARAVPETPVTLSANPMHDRISFSVNGNAVRSVTVYAQDGRIMHRGGSAWNGIDGNGQYAQPGAYCYRIEHDGGIHYGSFLKAE